MVAPGAGTGGQNLDLALILADEGPTGKADPAFDAHGLPIGEWSLAIWEGRESTIAMHKVIAKAKQTTSRAKKQWAVCKGPGAAYLLTCQRLGWTVIDATLVRTDLDELLDLRLDPPAVVLQHCDDAVRRWRWRRVERIHPKLAAAGSGRGPLMEPIWKLIKSKAEGDEWNHHHRGGLKSAIANRQFPQVRMHACGFASHDKCLVCLNKLVEAERGGDTLGGDGHVDRGQEAKRSVKDTVEASEDQLRRAPKGDLTHRIWRGDCLKPLRQQRATEEDCRCEDGEHRGACGVGQRPNC